MRGEVFIPRRVFEHTNAEREEQGEPDSRIRATLRLERCDSLIQRLWLNAVWTCLLTI